MSALLMVVVGCQSQTFGQCAVGQAFGFGRGYHAGYTITDFVGVESCMYRASVTWDWQPDDTELPSTLLTRTATLGSYVGTVVWTDSGDDVMAYQRVEPRDEPLTEAEGSSMIQPLPMSAETDEGVVSPATAEQALSTGSSVEGPRPMNVCEPLAWPPQEPLIPPYERIPIYPCDDVHTPDDPGFGVEP